MVRRMKLEDVKKQMFAAIKAGRIIEKEVLRTVIGEVTQLAAGAGRDATEDDIERVLRKILKNNTETLTVTEDHNARCALEEENRVVEALLPKTLDAAAIDSMLSPVADAIRAATGDGPATGIAMKHLKGVGATVNGKDVAEAVKRLRG